MFADLLAEPGVTETVALRSSFGLMAFHGGSLERGTDAVAERAACQAGASLYTVVLPEGLNWHVPSHRVDPTASVSLRAFLDHVEVVVALHGYGRDGMWTSILAGGRNRRLARHVGAALRPGLDGYVIVDDLDEIPRELRGLDPRNPVNLAAGAGVHLELPPRVRGIGPYWADHDRTLAVPHTEALVDGLALAIRTWTG